MRDRSALCRLSFILPDNLYATVPRGRHAPCLHGCLLTVHGAGLVSVVGYRDAAFEQVQRFLRVVGRGHGQLSIEARLQFDDEAGHPVSERWLVSAGRPRPIEPSAPMLPGFDDVTAA